jgi:hypothetical protein
MYHFKQGKAKNSDVVPNSRIQANVAGRNLVLDLHFGILYLKAGLR